MWWKKTTLKAVKKTENFDIAYFKQLIVKIKEAQKKDKEVLIKELIEYEHLIKHHEHKAVSVLAESKEMEYDHELHTCRKLNAEGYQVIFVPKGYFSRKEKRFDVFLIKGHLLFEADLKCIHSANSDTIGNRIKEGSEQSRRLVLDMHSTLTKSKLIEGLRTGCVKNENLLEIMLFYNSAFYRLPKSQIMAKSIFDIIK